MKIFHRNHNLFKCSLKKFSLYIPNKKLIFHNHPIHGRVYPVYIADDDYNKKHNLKIVPILSLFTAFNSFIFFTNLQLLPMTTLYKSIYFKINELFLITSAFTNYYLLRKYFKFLSNYNNRVKSLYLLPSGDKLIIENFDGSVKKLDILDIFESNLRNKYEDIRTKRIKWFPSLVTNDNNLSCSIRWGRNTENFFEGKRKILDYEIFTQIISRCNIDTTIKKFSVTDNYGIYTKDDKRKVLKYFQNRRWIKKIDKNRLSYHYKLLRKRYLDKAKPRDVKDEFKLY